MRNLLIDLAQVLRFYSRLPIPVLPGERQAHAAPDFARLVWAIPLGGALLGGLAALVLYGSAQVFNPFIAATLAVAAAVWMTGAFHEDGLADTADGLGGGMTRERKLEIMRDSRIGTFGGAALILALLLRTGALEGLVANHPAKAALALAVSGGVSRMMAIAVLFALPPARLDGAAFAAGQPGKAMTLLGALLACLMLAILVPVYGPVASLLAALLASIAVAIMIRLAKISIGGQTGDIAGAAQQAAEIGLLLGLLGGMKWTG